MKPYEKFPPDPPSRRGLWILVLVAVVACGVILISPRLVSVITL